MANKTTLGEMYWQELESEAPATRKCLERVPENLFNYKPHDKSMKMGDLAMIVAEIPNWISTIIEQSEIDFATYKQTKPKNADELVKHLDGALAKAKKVLQDISDEEFEKNFDLKHSGKVLASSSKNESVRSSINHLVHHRGQLTVYLRLNDIPVPKIYGPSADEQGF